MQSNRDRLNEKLTPTNAGNFLIKALQIEYRSRDEDWENGRPMPKKLRNFLYNFGWMFVFFGSLELGVYLFRYLFS
ncbi:MAG: hypothetical protein R3261_13055 [Alphaproteobacteria bacterium]|nr:hypothetical protein [Alphaproteobacteria bacterium]